MALKCNKCGTVGSDVLFQPVEGRCPNCGSHSISPLQLTSNKYNWTNELEAIIYRVHTAFADNDITTDQHIKIIDILTTAKNRVDDIVKEVDTATVINNKFYVVKEV